MFLKEVLTDITGLDEFVRLFYLELEKTVRQKDMESHCEESCKKNLWRDIMMKFPFTPKDQQELSEIMVFFNYFHNFWIIEFL